MFSASEYPIVALSLDIPDHGCYEGVWIWSSMSRNIVVFPCASDIGIVGGRGGAIVGT